MVGSATAKHLRMSPRKARLVVDQIRGRRVSDAVAILDFSKKAAAIPVGKTLRSAVANAQDLADKEGERVDVDALVVHRAFVDGGPMLKRWKAAAMGRAAPRRRRTSHVTVVVAERGA